MIFLHAIVGLILGIIIRDYFWFVFIGSVCLDIDHLKAYLFQAKIKNLKQFFDVVKHENKYGIRARTKFVHSILGLIFFTLIILPFNVIGGLWFGLGYGIHLFLDGLDKDVKYFLYPLSIKSRGFLPIWSKQEKILTILSLMILIILFVLFLIGII